jgi:hypothetical protein
MKSMRAWLPTRTSLLVPAAVLIAAAGCSTETITVEPDAYLCYSGGIPEGAREEGTVELGTGIASFEQLEPDQDLVLVQGIQGGTHFDVHARIRGMDPGDATDTRHPDNPRTIFKAYAEDGTRLDGASCGWTLGYEEAGDWAYISSGRRLVLLLRHREHFDRRVRLLVEVLDAQGRYAKDEIWVNSVREDGALHGPHQ